MASVALRSSRSFSYPTGSESSALAFALRVGEADPTGAPKPRLLDRVRAAIRARHYSRRTEKAYVAWIRRYIFFHDKRHPADMGAPEVTRFLSSLAVDGKVAASTQNQALSALLFLYGEVLAVDLPRYRTAPRWIAQPRAAGEELVSRQNHWTAGTRTGKRDRCYTPPCRSVWGVTLVSVFTDRI